MEKLKAKATVIQNCMHDSVANDFGKVSYHDENDSTPLEGQQDEQLTTVKGAENVIEYDASDISTEYSPWSTETNDSCDFDEVTFNRT